MPWQVVRKQSDHVRQDDCGVTCFSLVSCLVFMPLQLDKTDEKSEVPVVLNMSAYNSTLQNPCQSSVHNGHKQRTVQTELQHYCYVSCKVFTSSSHLMPTFQHKMRNMESRNYMKLSLSLYIYMVCIVSSFLLRKSWEI